MRITTGIYRGRLINGPRKIRPTQDKVRKALFDILGDVGGLSFLELYAGSGAVGLEAASRGVRELVMVEHDRDCLMAIKRNIEALKPRACELYPKQADFVIQLLHKDKRKFDLVFLDPPYYRGLSKKTLQTIGAYDILAPDGFVVVQHFKKDELPKKEGGLALVKQSKYGDTLLSFYRKD